MAHRIIMGSARLRFARALEAGAYSESLIARGIARAYGAVASRRVARPLRLPPGVRVVGVGGAVLGGAGKTAVAVALARELARAGHLVAFVGHAYGARPKGARVVASSDPLELAGDDALFAAAELPHEVAVVVGKNRQEALDLASRLAPLIVVDGLLQTSPHPLTDAVLVLDGDEPWGSGEMPPRGDLRASREALLAAADHVAVLVGDETTAPPVPGALMLASRIEGAGSPLVGFFDVAALRRIDVGLFVTVARPHRIERALERLGVRFRVSVGLADHAVPTPDDLARAARSPVDAWLTTARCAPKFPKAIGGVPVLALRHRVDVGPLMENLRAILPPG